jgi:hypothetical protein
MSERKSRRVQAREAAMIDALVEGGGVAGAARASGYTERTVRQRMEEPEIRERLDLAREQQFIAFLRELHEAGQRAIAFLDKKGYTVRFTNRGAVIRKKKPAP